MKRQTAVTRYITLPLAALAVAPAIAQTGPPYPAPLSAGSPATAALPPPAPLPASDEAWSQAATRDIYGAYTLLRENHPGMVDPQNRGFARQLDRARTVGLALAVRVTSAMGYDAAMAAFGNALQDGHAGANAILPPTSRPARQWPGFVPAWRGDRMVIHFSDQADAPRGAEITACDGTAIRTLALRNVFRFRGRAAEPGNWWIQARNVLVDTGNPFIDRPAMCRLRQDGRTWTIRLNWRAEEGRQFADWRSASYNGVTLPIGVTNPAPGITWVAMPDFDPDSAGVAAYQQMSATLQAQRPTIVQSRAVVLDLRNNQGGSSGWSRDIARRLWGGDAVNARMGRYFARTSIVWRASAGNEAHLRGTVASIRTAGFADVADQWLSLADQMSAARARGAETIDEPLEGAGMALPPIVPSDFTAPVYVIVPGQCASACLDAIDVFARFPNTRLIGAPSSGDSKYMEVRTEVLPSGLAQVTIPTKMWVDRPRGHGAGYLPAITVATLDWSTDDFLRTVETDLARRAQTPREPAAPGGV